MGRFWGFSALVVALCVAQTWAVRIKGSTEIDIERAKYLKLQDDMWALVEQGTIQKHDIEEKLYSTFRDLATSNWTARYKENEFAFLQRFYEWNLVEKDLLGIEGLWGAFKHFLANQFTANDFNELAAMDFADTVFHDKQLTMNGSLDSVHRIMVKQGFYYKAAMEAKNSVCSTKQSPQQMMFQLYNVLSLTELKGYAMMQFSWMLLKTYGKGNFAKEAEIMKNQFNERTNQTQTLLKRVMERADRSVWRCDPTHHVSGETYEEITRLLQGYIENEVDLNADGTCMENCAAYQYTESHGCFKGEKKYCSRQEKCNGKLLHCRYVDSDMWICPARTSSNRRYEYIEYENGKVFGKQQNCVRGTTKVDSWWRYLFWHCSYCFCLCDQQGKKSDRYFNLRESVSNVVENKVVTGVRFKKQNRIIHIQIQEGRLLPRGAIDPDSVEWKPVSDYTIFDRGIRNGHDYHTLKWDNRSFDLDDLMAKPSHVLTGVKFRVVGTHLNLEIRVNEFDFASGRIDPTGEWISNDNTDQSSVKRRELRFNRPDIPTASQMKSLPDSDPNQYFDFVNSDLDSDAAQSTVPFIDIQEVTSEPLVPLSGVGTYHKGRDLSGGFVALKIITYDFSPHIQLPDYAEN
ncbi:uncharacterized protein LOC134836578 isoform X2 [Culicoides brevitarsis]|uniref:uncharacterized protein LOC134836578 isoform X2 n=1 Tax=Culicoides brevitarsis TaxID=469753 RepID=UPI00307B2CBA